MERVPSKILVPVALFVAVASSVAAQPCFPVARAEKEFWALTTFAKGFGENHQGDQDLFEHWILPFAPLDLQVGNANHEEASALRNFYLGFVGAAFKMNPAKLANDFHCGEPCTHGRFDDLAGKLPQIEKVVAAFKKLKGVDVLASWGIKGEFRVNALFKIGRQTNITAPSPVMSFTPSASWTPGDADAYITSLGASPAAVREVREAQEALSIAALVREPDGDVRVIRIGIADNEAGLLFPSGKGPALTRGTKLPDGREITFVRDMKGPILFYETT